MADALQWQRRVALKSLSLSELFPRRERQSGKQKKNPTLAKCGLAAAANLSLQ
jgi:hypothetical protein